MTERGANVCFGRIIITFYNKMIRLTASCIARDHQCSGARTKLLNGVRAMDIAPRGRICTTHLFPHMQHTGQRYWRHSCSSYALKPSQTTSYELPKKIIKKKKKKDDVKCVKIFNIKCRDNIVKSTHQNRCMCT